MKDEVLDCLCSLLSSICILLMSSICSLCLSFCSISSSRSPFRASICRSKLSTFPFNATEKSSISSTNVFSCNQLAKIHYKKVTFITKKIHYKKATFIQRSYSSVFAFENGEICCLEIRRRIIGTRRTIFYGPGRALLIFISISNRAKPLTLKL